MSQENQFLSVIRIWAAAAWADGVVVDREREAMKRLIASADLTSEERETALGWLDEKVELDAANVRSLAEDARRGIYRAAARLAAVDHDVADAERTFLARLRQALDIDEDIAREIEANIPGHERPGHERPGHDPA